MKDNQHFQNTILTPHKTVLCNDTFYRTFGEIERNISETEDISYVTNSCGHRSDEFAKNHDGLHILFAGCSVTFGEGLPYMSNWSGKLHNKISKKIKTSGYFNLSFLGGSTELIISNINKYIINYGAPDIIFMHIPESLRGMFYSGGYQYYISKDIKELKKQNLWYAYNMILAIEIICKYANIKLLWTTWDEKDNEFYKAASCLDGFIPTTHADIFISSSNKEEKTYNYYGIGRDNAHPGLKYSDGLSNIFYNEMIKRWPELKG
jgi:hypothetical protein